MLRIWIFICFSFFGKILFSQFAFEVKEGPLVRVSGRDLSHAFMGGLNSPQFSEADLNRDGSNDLVVFDRADFKIYTFLRSQKNQYVYAPQYEAQLPAGKNIYVLRDMNSDGLEDVFTTSDGGDLLIYKNNTGIDDKRLKFDTVGPWYYRNQYANNFPILYNPLSFSNASTDLLGIEDIDGDGDIDIVNYDQFNLTYMMLKDVRSEKNWDKDTFEFQNMDYCFGYFWEGFDSEIRLNTCPFDLDFPLKLKPRHVGGASCWFFDEDGDGDMEMYLANLDFKRITRLVNGKANYNQAYDTMISVDSTFLDGKPFDSYVFPAGYMIDVDNDGLKDMIIAPNSAFETKERNQIMYYKNHGTKKGADFKLNRSNFIIEQMLDLGGQSSPGLIDIDSDGDLDLLVLNNGDYDETMGLSDRLSLFENKGDKQNPIFELNNSDFLGLSDSALVGSTLSVGDIDNDGLSDILIGTLKGQLFWFKKELNRWECKSNQLVQYSKQSGESSWAPAVIDYNKDGISDLLIGFYNGNVALFKGTSSKGTPAFEWITSKAWGMKANEWMLQNSEPNFSSYGYAAPAVSDIDGDGSPEVLIGGFENVLRVYHIEGHDPSDSLIANDNILFSVFEGDTSSVRIGGRIRPCAGDLVGDSIPELILGNLRGGLNFASHILSDEISVNTQNPIKGVAIIQPNPVRLGSRFDVVSPDLKEKWTVTVYDLHGKQVSESLINAGESGVSIRTEGLSASLYFVSVSNDSRGLKSTHKIIVLE